MAGSHAKPGPVQRLRNRTRRTTETSEYAAMIIRVLYGYGQRIGEDPAALAHLRDIENTLRDAVNLGIFTANRSGNCPYSLAEIGAVVGISRQGVHKRVGLGERVLVRMEAARAGGALVRLADVRAARAKALAAAGVEDKTGSAAELRAAASG